MQTRGPRCKSQKEAAGLHPKLQSLNELVFMRVWAVDNRGPNSSNKGFRITVYGKHGGVVLLSKLQKTLFQLNIYCVRTKCGHQVEHRS